MTFGEKLKCARLALNISQSELSERTGISERSLYAYEKAGVIPRKRNIKKISEALGVSVGYLMDEDETDRRKQIDSEILEANIRNEYGARGAGEATELLNKASELFAGEKLDDVAKDVFFRSLVEVYLESKQNGRIDQKKRASKRIKD